MMREANIEYVKERLNELDQAVKKINPTLKFIGLPFEDRFNDARALYFQTEKEAKAFDDLFDPDGEKAVTAFNRYGEGWYTYIVSYDNPHIWSVRKWQSLVNLCHSVIDDWVRVQEKQMRDCQFGLNIADWGHDL